MTDCHNYGGGYDLAKGKDLGLKELALGKFSNQLMLPKGTGYLLKVSLVLFPGLSEDYDNDQVI